MSAALFSNISADAVIRAAPVWRLFDLLRAAPAPVRRRRAPLVASAA
jgi:hypothetical protein